METWIILTGLQIEDQATKTSQSLKIFKAFVMHLEYKPLAP
jgi:hypothetical protein